MNKKQLIKVIFKKELSKSYVFKTSKEVQEKDIVYCDTSRGPQIGIVVEEDVDLDALDKLPGAPKEANYVCKSTHDITTSKNMPLKAMLIRHDVALYELSDAYDVFKAF